eukprot:5053706-Alexandrium_andersonii.AAC.1
MRAHARTRALLQRLAHAPSSSSANHFKSVKDSPRCSDGENPRAPPSARRSDSRLLPRRIRDRCSSAPLASNCAACSVATQHS